MMLEPVLHSIRKQVHRQYEALKTKYDITVPICVAQGNKTKLGRRVYDEVFRHPADMGHR